MFLPELVRRFVGRGGRSEQRNAQRRRQIAQEGQHADGAARETTDV
jgi:hypothetical protein